MRPLNTIEFRGIVGRSTDTTLQLQVSLFPKNFDFLCLDQRTVVLLFGMLLVDTFSVAFFSRRIHRSQKVFNFLNLLKIHFHQLEILLWKRLTEKVNLSFEPWTIHILRRRLLRSTAPPRSLPLYSYLIRSLPLKSLMCCAYQQRQEILLLQLMMFVATDQLFGSILWMENILDHTKSWNSMFMSFISETRSIYWCFAFLIHMYLFFLTPLSIDLSGGDKNSGVI